MVACATAPAMAPAAMRCAGVISSGSGATTCGQQTEAAGKGSAEVRLEQPCDTAARGQAIAQLS
jgi:hypothetical protein